MQCLQLRTANKMTETEQLPEFQKKLGYSFKNRQLLEEALTHASYANERGSSVYNERLEFLGDAVLELISSEMLYGNFKDYDEGKLTRLRSQLVRGTALVAWAKEMRLAGLIKTGRSLKGNVTDAMLENAGEAVFGAIFLDSDYETARTVARRFFNEQIKNSGCDTLDPKTALQQYTQADGSGTVPHYTTVSRPMPGKDTPFEVFVYIADKKIANGLGKSIKEAEFDAAKKAMEILLREKE